MKRILIVEDEKNIAEIERDYLELDGFEVIIENNGVNGQQRALKEDFDLVILDKDIFTCPADEIKDALPVITMLGGEIVYERQ